MFLNNSCYILKNTLQFLRPHIDFSHKIQDSIYRYRKCHAPKLWKSNFHLNLCFSKTCPKGAQWAHFGHDWENEDLNKKSCSNVLGHGTSTAYVKTSRRGLKTQSIFQNVSRIVWQFLWNFWGLFGMDLLANVDSNKGHIILESIYHKMCPKFPTFRPKQAKCHFGAWNFNGNNLFILHQILTFFFEQLVFFKANRLVLRTKLYIVQFRFWVFGNIFLVASHGQ